MIKYLSLWAGLASLPILAATIGWRMDGSSRFPSATPPTQWSTTEHVEWAVELPNWGNGSPILVGDHIFVCAEPDTLLCLDRTGAIRWQRTNGYEELLSLEDRTKLADERKAAAVLDPKINEQRRLQREKRNALKKAETDAKAAPDDAALADKVTILKAEIATVDTAINALLTEQNAFTLAQRWRMPETHPTNGYSSDTPVSDGQRVYVSFGTGVVACYSLDGTRRWLRFIEKPTHGWGHSCSPVLVGNTLIVQFVDMHGLDAGTGETRWKSKRQHYWGTPSPLHLGKIDAVMTDWGEIVNVADGTSLLQTDGKTPAASGMPLEYNSPLISDGVAYCVSGKSARAIKLTGADDGTVSLTQLWETPVNNDRYYASPLLHEGLLYVVNQQGVLSVLDAATGVPAYSEKLGLGGTCYPSPILAGNVIILGSDNGKAVVLTPGRTYAEIARPTLEPYMGTPICDGARIYIRTNPHGGKSRLYSLVK